MTDDAPLLPIQRYAEDAIKSLGGIATNGKYVLTPAVSSMLSAILEIHASRFQVASNGLLDKYNETSSYRDHGQYKYNKHAKQAVDDVNAHIFTGYDLHEIMIRFASNLSAILEGVDINATFYSSDSNSISSGASEPENQGANSETETIRESDKPISIGDGKSDDASNKRRKSTGKRCNGHGK